MKQLIAANWKMNGMPDWVDRVGALDTRAGGVDEAELLVCPPNALVGLLAFAAKDTAVTIGGQDCSAEEAGAHTGETDAALLKALGARYVIVGHSERRAGGESDADVKAKAERAIAVGLRPVVCVGESLGEREAGHAVATVRAQLSASLPTKGHYDLAYEPIWAIGSGRVAEVSDIADMHAAIREAVGPGPRILYGGSVKPDNAQDILSTPEVGGALVGGASLDPESFSAIARHAVKQG